MQTSPGNAMVNASSSYLVELDSLLQGMREEQDPTHLASYVVSFVNNTFAPSLIWLATYDEYHHQLIGQGGISQVADYAPLNTRVPLDPGSILEQVIIEQTLITIPDLPQESRMGMWQSDSKRLGVQGCLIIPIKHQRRLMGVLMMGTQAWGAFIDDNEKAVLGMLLGQYGLSLHTIEQSWQREATKQAAEPLIALGNAIRHDETLDARLRTAIAHIEAFVEHTTSQVYAFVYEQSLFQLLLSTKPKMLKGEALLTRDLGPLYTALLEGQTVVWGTDQGSLRIPLNPRLMQRWKCESAILVPIVAEGYLWGFFTVESAQSRLWQVAEEQFISGVAHLLSLAAPLEQLELSLAQMKADLALRIELAQVVQAGTEYEQIWQLACQSLVERLKVNGCMIVCPDVFEQVYAPLHIYCAQTVKGLGQRLSALTDNEWNDVKRGEAIAAEHFPQDLRMLCWQEDLKSVRSLLVAPLNVVEGQHVDGFLLMVHTSPRAWSRAERELVMAVAKQVGVVLRQQQLSIELERQTLRLQSMPLAWTQLLNATTLPQLCELTSRYLTEWLHLPWAGIVNLDAGWLASTPKQELELEPPPPQDQLVQWAIQSPHPLALHWADVPESSRSWLNVPHLDIVLAFYLPAVAPTPPLLIVAGATALHSWPPEAIALMEWLGRACSYLVQQQAQTQHLVAQLEGVHMLNWYKHRRLSAVRLDLVTALRAAKQELAQTPVLAKAVQELGRDLGAVVQADYSEVAPSRESVAAGSVIRSVLQRLDGVIKQQKLWARVQGESSLLAWADPGRLDMVLQELVTIAIRTLRPESRLEIWLREAEDTVQILVMGPMIMPPELITELAIAPVGYSLTPTPSLAKTPGRELLLCRQMLQSMGGNLLLLMSPEGKPVIQMSLVAVPESVAD